MTCSQCGSDNADTRAYCHACGTRVALICSHCGFSNEATAHYCGGCGRDVAATTTATRFDTAYALHQYTAEEIEELLEDRQQMEAQRKSKLLTQDELDKLFA
jgi:hypothetical protein